MTIRNEEVGLRRQMHDQFDTMELPESLSSRILDRIPVRERRAPEPLDSPRSKAIPKRKHHTAVVLAAAASVGAVALAGAILTQRFNEPDSVSTSATSAIASPINSTVGSTITSQLSTGITGDLIRDTYPYVSCGASWGHPIGSADLTLDPTWPEALSTTKSGTVSATVTNAGREGVTGTDRGLVVVLRDGVVAGAGYPDAALVGRMSFVLAPGDSFTSTTTISGMYLCDRSDRQPPLFGAGYEAVYVERFGSHIAFSAPVRIAVQR